jgi:hypothetical protein
MINAGGFDRLRDNLKSKLHPGADAHEAWARAALIVAAVIAGIWAQGRIDVRQSVSLAVGTMAFAAIVFVISTARIAWLAPTRPSAQGQGHLRTRRWATAGAIISFLSVLGQGDNQMRLWPTLAWLMGMALLWWGVGEDDAPPLMPRLRIWWQAHRQGITVGWTGWALLAILVVAGYLRFRLLDQIPAEMGVDMPLIYDNIKDLLAGQIHIFFTRHPGRESLYFYLAWLPAHFLGPSHLLIKAVSAAIGMATIVLIYFVGAYLCDRRVGLLAAAVLAVDRWHLILSRTGYRASLMPFFTLLVLWLGARALDSRRDRDYVLLGLATGLGLHTYNSFLAMPFVVLAGLVVQGLLRGGIGWLRQSWRSLGLWAVATGLIYLPLARYALQHTDSYLFRVSTRITGVEAALPQDLLKTLLGNVWNMLLMFNWQGDTVFYINVPMLRQLGLVTAPLLAIGLAAALWRWRRGHVALWLVIWLGSMSPTALALAFPQEVPNAVRACGAIGPTVLFVAAALVLAGRGIAAALPGSGWQHRLQVAIDDGRRWEWNLALPAQARWLAVIPVVALLMWQATETSHLYFNDYVQRLPDQNYSITLEMARVIDDSAGGGQAVIVPWPYWYDGNALRVQLEILGRPMIPEVPQPALDQPPLRDLRGAVLFIYHPDDKETEAKLRAWFPQALAINHLRYDGAVAFKSLWGTK